MSYGTIFSIEEFSVYDGPGIRTAVFLKGCPLRCTWCHNPEGQDFERCIVRSPNGCMGCNACINSVVEKDGKIVFTEESIKKCPMNLLRYCGEKTDSEELVLRLMKNRQILKDGGITFSGGEPLAQSEFLTETKKSDFESLEAYMQLFRKLAEKEKPIIFGNDSFGFNRSTKTVFSYSWGNITPITEELLRRDLIKPLRILILPFQTKRTL